MPWFKVDDKLHDHRKARAAGKAAMGVWALAGSWAADNLTDGFVPASVLSRWGTRADARRLVDVGLWFTDEQDGERGWRFWEWTERNPTRAEVEADREAARLRMSRRRRTKPPAGSEDVRANTARTSEPVQQPRPDPTRPDAAAAASADPATPPLPGAVEVLRSRIESRRITVRWDKLDPTQLDEIVALLELHGDGPLVDAAVRSYRQDSPPAFAQAWLGIWRSLPEPGHRLRDVSTPACSEPGHTGNTTRCNECASERLAGDRP